ncbi:TIGR03618 family F420-dependent PPOX class oxidoreductase [Amycolatopsis cynarae]|uniref:TIGR03618 family F420-dependent PPOX class oxidoreductase n=1 Tax=Amycolatopsis cynarae TaxID=2995223 RepID=A0ABY7AUX7_9PSEU|nr:TIGR03618 family F420-dependent PPOX class oxidoreductase [Amycolatopsis sp. HUAS 11-8]WAL63537.1 TIGR03618 family F420-dependent PPOX class oxidoreductase [Amycolatopsis sp. HUAS 11-8]
MTLRAPLPAAARAFLVAPRAATLTTLRGDGSLHAVAVRFTWDEDTGIARVLTRGSSGKVRNLAAAPGRAALCQAEGFRWITLEGPATVSADPRRVAEAARRYALRYLALPPDPPGRVVIEIAVERVMHLNC